MRLADWLEREGWTLGGFAQRLDRDHKTVWRYALAPEDPRARLPNREAMAAIYRATGGRVQPNDFYALPPLPGEPERRVSAARECGCSEAAE